MAANNQKSDAKSEGERQAEFFKTQEYLMKNWVGTTVDPKTGEVERRIIMNGRPFMSNAKGFGYV